MADIVGFKPNHDEAARQAFVGSLKEYINFGIEARLEQVYKNDLVPAFQRDHGVAPKSRSDATSVLEPHPLFKLWSTLTFHSQNVMWDAVQRTTDRTIDKQVKNFETLSNNPERLGAMSLQDDLVVQAPISTTEIHRQPGGYWREKRPNDIEAALNYAGTVDLYRNAKGMGRGGKIGSDSIGQFLASVAKKRAPDLNPKDILDMGCGSGEQTLAYKRVFPEATVTGIDCARPFVRYAHGFAESQGLAINFAEMDAGHTDYEDESFDLIVSIIMFHETTSAQVRQILKESQRLLKTGGLVLHLDVPYQPHRMPLFQQVTNHWQVRNNGEPFWTGFAELDIHSELVAAGFDEKSAFAEYESAGPATYFFFGGRK